MVISSDSAVLLDAKLSFAVYTACLCNFTLATGGTLNHRNTPISSSEVSIAVDKRKIISRSQDGCSEMRG